ncbi:hypothetical protein BGZ70_002239 [Mortierella alpina]|uniref:SAP domain-containing protein n=1 Tax=Mortierella alpina TaxID=64518 RepID=A0A9P6IUV5_MORAP|nr:hypothetical protein BGZ70_002239 [Mortierella alpina]
MTAVDDIREQLRQLGLDTRGNKSTLKARLRKHLKKETKQSGSTQAIDPATVKGADGIDSADLDIEETLVQDPEKGRQEQAMDLAETPRRPLHMNSRYDYYLCFDVEATCEKGFSFEFPNEVIEFPVVLLNGSSLEVVDEFHSYVRPTNRPILSDFCIELTGITQHTIDEAPTFTEVLSLFEDWLTKHNIILGEYTPPNSADSTGNNSNKKAKKSKSKKNKKNNANNNPFQHAQSAAAINDFSYGATFCFVTDGPFDIRDFIGKQCLHSGIPRPSYFAQSYLDIRTLFRAFFDLIHWLNLEGMLKFLGETFEGRQHSGICDARMVGLIARRLANGFSYEQDNGDSDSISTAAVFSEENKPYIATQWSDTKLQKLRAGCVLKANRTTDQTFVKMMPFKRLAKLEELPALVAAGAAMPPPQPKKQSEREDMDDNGDNDDDGQVDQNVVCFGEASSSSRTRSSPPLSKISSPESSPRIAPTKAASFVQESKFAALMSD